MGTASRAGFAVLLLLCGCGQRAGDAADPRSAAEAALGNPPWAEAADTALGADNAPSAPSVPTPAADAAEAPVLRAPTLAELVQSCPLGDGTAFSTFIGHVENARFEAIDALFQEMLDAYRKTPACEHYLTATVDFLRGVDFAALDRWVAERPDSWAALTTRGSKWVDAGYQSRGTKFARDVTEEQWKRMYEAFEHADRDLRRAIEIEPDAYPAYEEAIHLRRAAGGKQEWGPWLDALLARDPLNFSVREAALHALGESWGGSAAEMQAVAESAQRFADRNPRLRLLLGYSHAEQGLMHRRAERHAETAAAYRRALSYGDHRTWYDELARSLEVMGDWQAVLEVADRWIAALPDHLPYYWRGRALTNLRQPKLALAAYDRAIQYAPDSPYAYRMRAHAHLELGEIPKAATDLERSLELQDSSWALGQLADIASGDPQVAARNEALARRQIEKQSDDPAAWFLLANALQARGAPEARSVLERYVALATGNGGESRRLATARRTLDPRPDSRALPALEHFGVVRPELARGSAQNRS